MKKKLVCGLLTLAVLLCLPVADSMAADPDSVVTYNLQQDEESPPKRWNITMAATVVANQGDRLAVYLRNPGNMKIEETDDAQHLQVLPIGEKTVLEDEAGNALKSEQILPGQTVKVTFTYYWHSVSPRRGSSVESCAKVVATGELVQVKSTMTLNETAAEGTALAKDTMTATILSVEGDTIRLYIEAGKAYYGDNEYFITGVKSAGLTQGTAIIDENGKAVQKSSLKPLQRITVKFGDAMWAESYPPIYAPQSITDIQLVGQGERIILPQEIANFTKISCTVVAKETDADGRAKIVVEPQAGSRAANLAKQYTILESGWIHFLHGQSPFPAIQVGSVLEVRYSSINYAADEPVIDYSSISIL